MTTIGKESMASMIEEESDIYTGSHCKNRLVLGTRGAQDSLCRHKHFLTQDLVLKTTKGTVATKLPCAEHKVVTSSVKQVASQFLVIMQHKDVFTMQLIL
jgi:hypothetical protein